MTGSPVPTLDRSPGGDLLEQQVAIMVRFTRRSVVIIVLGLALMTTLLVPFAGWPRFILWAGLILTALAIRAATLAYVFRRQTATQPMRQAERVITVTTGLLGMCIASGAYIFYPVADFAMRALLTVILCAWPAGGVAVLGAHPRSFLAYLVLYFVVLCSAWLIYEPHFPAVSALMILYATMIGFLSIEIGRLIARSVILAREKDALLAEKDALLAEKDSLIVELDSARNRAEEADHYKSRFLAAASHDLRQPVTALSLLAGTLAESTLESKVQALAEHIVRGLQALESLFTSILDLSKLEAGAVETNPAAFGLEALFSDLAQEFRSRFAAKGVEFTVTARPLWLVTDRVHLERIIRNLLENALRYTERGRVTLAVEPRAGECSIIVSDTGPGIAPAEHERIFGDFYQLGARTARTRNAGLGLGLGIVRRLAQILGVSISLRSQVGRGSTFSIDVPAAMLSPAPAHEVDGEDADDVSLSGRVVAVIDDNADVRDAFALALDRWGATPVVARDCREALAQLAAAGRSPDLVIADYHLAGDERGTATIAAFREAYPRLPALLMTGDGAIAALAAHGMDVLQKPIAYSMLGRRIAALVATRHEDA